jgi:hypothetical protein
MYTISMNNYSKNADIQIIWWEKRRHRQHMFGVTSVSFLSTSKAHVKMIDTMNVYPVS